MSRPKKEKRVFEAGQILVFKSTSSLWSPGYEAMFILEKNINNDESIRYVFLEVNISNKGKVHQRRFDYAESTFLQRIRGHTNNKSYEELEFDRAKLDVVVSTGSSIAMLLQEAITLGEKGVLRRIEWYQQQIVKEQQQMQRLVKGRELLNG